MIETNKNRFATHTRVWGVSCKVRRGAFLKDPRDGRLKPSQTQQVFDLGLNSDVFERLHVTEVLAVLDRIVRIDGRGQETLKLGASRTVHEGV